MNVICNSQALAVELRLLDKIAASKSPIPVLMNVLFEASTDGLRLTATDLEVGLITTCKATIEEPGSITLPANKLLGIIEQMPNNDVHIVVNDKGAKISSGTFQSRLQTWPAADFPTMPIVEGPISALDGVALKTLISKTRFAITDKAQMYVIDGALLSLTGNTAAMVTTDGKRLSVATAPWAGEPLSAIIPTKTLDVLVAQDLVGKIEICRSDKHLFFIIGGRTLFSRMLEAKFPAYGRIIPKDHDKNVVINPKVLASTLRRVGVVSEKTQAVIITIRESTTKESTLVVSVRNVEVGEAEEQVRVNYTCTNPDVMTSTVSNISNGGPEIKLQVNWKFVLDFLEAAVGQTVTMALKDSTSPLLLTDGTDFLNVVLGIRS